MVQAHAHLGYAPRGVGLLYAVFWFEQEADVLGWYIGAVYGEIQAAYFVLPNYYTARPSHLLRSAQDDVYGPWIESSSAGEQPVAHPPPVPEALCHELARLQDQFIRHWLFFGDDPQAQAEAQALRDRELSVRAVNIRPSRLGKLTTGAAVWHFDAPGADPRVLAALSRRWPLDHRIDV